MRDSLNIVVAGATGYIGLELVRILSKHPKANILYLCATKNIGSSINKFNSKIKKNKLPKISKIKNVVWENIDVLFTALPNGEAQKIARIIPKKIKLIDLSADFRLKSAKEYLENSYLELKTRSKKIKNKTDRKQYLSVSLHQDISDAWDL